MFKRAQDNFQNNTKEADDWKTFMSHLNNANIVLTPWLLFFYFLILENFLIY